MTTGLAKTICGIFLIGCAILIGTPQALALPENQIRLLVQRAQEFEKQANWEKAREIYEALLGQTDPGLRIRDRYWVSLRQCRQTRRHLDASYRKEVLSVDYGQAMRICGIVNKTLLDGAFDKKKISPGKLFGQGVRELDNALADPTFLQHHVPIDKHGLVGDFRAALKRNWADMNPASREEAMRQIGEIALAAEAHLGLDATVSVMEFACGACYAIDEYTVYLTPNQLRELADNLTRNEAIGVGLTLDIRDNKIVIHRIADNSPVLQMDPPIRPNDQIVSINKKSIVDLPLNQIQSLLYGPVGTSVEIELVSADGLMARTMHIQRRTIASGVTFLHLMNTQYGYLKIGSFTDVTPQEVDAAISAFTQSSLKGLIVDLRENNGGIFESSIETARRFLSTGIIGSTLNARKSEVFHAKNPNALAAPLVVLIDNETASAAELLAGALKDNNRAVLIGQTTFGKGCTQAVLKLPNAIGNVPAGGMKLSVAQFFSPKGQPYSGRGVVPHIFLDERMVHSELNMMRNYYLDRAVEELNRMLSMPK